MSCLVCLVNVYFIFDQYYMEIADDAITLRIINICPVNGFEWRRTTSRCPAHICVLEDYDEQLDPGPES